MRSELEHRRMIKILREMYYAQMECFFMDEVMAKVMERMGLSEEEAVETVKYCLDQGWLKTGHFKPELFLRADYIRSFPVTLTSKAITLLKD